MHSGSRLNTHQHAMIGAYRRYFSIALSFTFATNLHKLAIPLTDMLGSELLK